LSGGICEILSAIFFYFSLFVIVKFVGVIVKFVGVIVKFVGVIVKFVVVIVKLLSAIINVGGEKNIPAFLLSHPIIPKAIAKKFNFLI
jgi:hypothetical protein